MHLILNRTTFSDLATEGTLSIDGVHECYTLEDKDRGLNFDTPIAEIKLVKIPGQTCIPYGQYQVIINESQRFGRMMPLLVMVPGFSGVRIHTGNTDKDTDGCILIGTQPVGVDFIGSSKIAFDAFFPKLEAAINRGDAVLLTIMKG